MLEITDAVLKQALTDDLPVIIIYNGKKEMTQRRIFVRSMGDGYITAYCSVKKGLRKFKTENILSAVIAESID